MPTIVTHKCCRFRRHMGEVWQHYIAAKDSLLTIPSNHIRNLPLMEIPAGIKPYIVETGQKELFQVAARPTIVTQDCCSLGRHFSGTRHHSAGQGEPAPHAQFYPSRTWHLEGRLSSQLKRVRWGPNHNPRPKPMTTHLRFLFQWPSTWFQLTQSLASRTTPTLTVSMLGYLLRAGAEPSSNSIADNVNQVGSSKGWGKPCLHFAASSTLLPTTFVGNATSMHMGEMR